MGSQKSILISLSKKHFTFYNNFHNNRARRTRAERNKSDELKKKNDDAFACFQTSCFTRVQHMRKIRYSLVFFLFVGCCRCYCRSIQHTKSTRSVALLRYLCTNLAPGPSPGRSYYFDLLYIFCVLACLLYMSVVRKRPI